jgi:hypothetical protein
VTTVKSRGTKGTVAGFSTLISDQKGARKQEGDCKGERFHQEEKKSFSVENKEEEKKGERVTRVEGNWVIKTNSAKTTPDLITADATAISDAETKQRRKKIIWYKFKLIYFI